MSATSSTIRVLFGILSAALLVSGCTTIGIGNAGYDNSTISLSISNAGAPSGGFIQVTVYEIRNYQQEETGTFYAPLTLVHGENTALIPGTLRPGQYKLYFYLIQNGDRKAAVIRDIVVN